jgi:hypothetical protein
MKVAEKNSRFSARRRVHAVAMALSALASAAPGLGRAAEIDTGNDDVKLRWDNTFKYSAAFRTAGRSETVLATYNPNLDDGDEDFDKGLVSNRIDLLSELDFVYKESVGLRISGAAWYDSVYNKSNDNPGFAGGAVPNALSVAPDQFTRATRNLEGRDAEVLDAFVFGKATLADTTVSGRAGRHTILWGESLFFGDNGIAGGQAPIDYIKLLSVPNSQFKEVIRPVDQVSSQIQLSSTLSVGAYLQLQWEPNRIPAVGSYLSRSDIFDTGGEQIYLPPQLGGTVPRISDLRARDSGQGGLQLRWRSEALDTDFGFYAIRYNDKNFNVYLQPGVDYRLVYQNGVRAFGASASRSFGEFNVAAEMSVRRNEALVGAGGLEVDPTGTGNNTDNPLYPVGSSTHGQVSVIHTLERFPLWDGGLFLGEIAWNHRDSVTRNPAALDPDTTRDAIALRMLFAPTYYQALPGIDLTVPVGLGYNPRGRSSVIPVWNGGWSKGGDLSAGLNFEYDQTWKGGLTYTYYFGKPGGVLDQAGNFSFAQSLKDRDFVALSVQRTF